ncbi:MAG: hypothetical protein ACTSR8_20550 [Promethearchaeota archaeon]
MTKKNRQKRGFLVALLIGFDEQAINLWKIYTHSIRSYSSLKLKRKWKYSDSKQKYHYYEDLVDLIRSLVREGLRSILLANAPKKDYSEGFLQHINKHHQWLVRSRADNKVSFGMLEGNARNLKDVSYLMSKEKSFKILNNTTSEEAELLIAQLEKSINANDKDIIVLYGLRDIEEIIYKGGKKDRYAKEKVDILLITENILKNPKLRNRVHRLKQIAKNKGIITRILPKESTQSDRINQFGGILCFKKV